MHFFDSIVPIIVLYKRSIENADSLKKLNEFLIMKGMQMDLFVYDNSPSPLYKGDFSFGNFDIRYVHDPFNSGVSRAYNFGAAYARALNKQWVLLLDQDTGFPENFLDAYEAAVQANPGTGIFAPVLETQYGDILSPCRYVRKQGYWLKDAPEGIWDLRRYSPVNSGMLINIDKFFEVGGYNEKVRLDFADFQFIERYQKLYNSFYVLNLVCKQDFSGYDTDLNRLKHRYAFFCEGARNCKREGLADRWWYLFAVVKRMISLIIKTKNVSFAGIFVQKYLYIKQD